MANMFKDFDEMFPDAANVPEDERVGRFKLFGKIYTFKKDIPALLMLELTRNEGKLNQRSICKLAYALFGEDAVTEMAMHPGFNFSMLDNVVAYAIRACNGDDEDEESMKELTEDDFGVKKPRKHAKN